MKAKDIDLFERLGDCITDRRLLNQLYMRLSDLNDDECSRFLEYLIATFPGNELARVIIYFLDLPLKAWKEIVGGRTGNDIFNHEDRITSLINELTAGIRGSPDHDSSAGNSEEEEKDPRRIRLLRIFRSRDFTGLGLTANQSLIIKLLLYVFNDNISRTAKFLGMTRQSVHEAAHQAFEKIRQNLNKKYF